MKWQTKYSKLQKWHKWFAWYPVYIGSGYRVWLIWVNRVWTCKMDGTAEGNCFFEYREIKNRKKKKNLEKILNNQICMVKNNTKEEKQKE